MKRPRCGPSNGLFDNGLTFKSVATLESVSSAANGGNPVLTLDRAVSSDLGQAGFIAGDLSASAGARYLFSNNVFAFNRGRALLLQTPYGWVNENRFVGQTFKEVYVLASQYWGEGPGAQELVLSKNQFDATGQNYLSGFFALDIMADASNIFFGITDTYTSRLPDISCVDSIMLQLSAPPPKISPFAPIACRIAATTSDLIFDRR